MKINLLVFTLFSILFFCLDATATETITITTYYPSPCGSYDELRARKVAIGDNYFNTSSYAWGIQVSAEADLVVEGRVGIGTASPVTKLEVKGGHGDSQIRLFSDQYSQGIGGGNTANLNLWASEPGWTWTGAGIGNNVINTSSGGLTRPNTSRGGSYIRLLDNTIYLNVLSGGSDRNAITIDGSANVGIGSTGPSFKLTVVDNSASAAVSVRQNNPSGYGIHIKPGSDNRYALLINNSSDSANRHIFYGDGGAVLANGAGRVGVGTTGPSYKLHVYDNGAGVPAIYGQNTNLGGRGVTGRGYVGVAGHGDSTDIWLGQSGNMRSPGRMHIQTASNQPLYLNPWPGGEYVCVGGGGGNGNLVVTGNAFKPGGGTWQNWSDERLKKNIEPLNGALALMLKLRGVRYQWKDPDKFGNKKDGVQIGLIAQDVEKVFPDWVGLDHKGEYKTIGFDGFEALTVEAVRELKADNDALRKNILKMQERISEIESMLKSG